MKEKLRSLYALQKLDSELDELHELRGDLPSTVEELSQSHLELQSRIDMLDSFLKHGAVERDRKEKDTFALMEKIETYNAQQLKVKTNKEYDALTKEIDNANETIKSYEVEIEQFAVEAKAKREQREELQAQLTILEEELTEKKAELEEIVKTTAEEEQTLQAKREKVVKFLTEDDLTSYLRIREAKKGRSVVAVKKGSCSGCYNVVPPQLILQIKKNDTLYLCEHCGRILISEELAQDKSPLG